LSRKNENITLKLTTKLAKRYELNIVRLMITTRIAATALALTGLSREAARFQVRSAFTGTGFNTREAEKVVDHPVRRQIIMLLMIARSAGVVSIIISLTRAFPQTMRADSRNARISFKNNPSDLPAPLMAATGGAEAADFF
jgi:hypothetical protein